MNLESPTLAVDPEQRRSAASCFERASDVMASGDNAHAVTLLQECCRLDPANLLYRQTLRRAARARYRQNGRGHWLAWLWNWPLRLQLSRAVAANRPADVLPLAERILANNPWDVAAQLAIARAAEKLQLLDVAIWALQQVRLQRPHDLALDRSLAALYEQRGHFTQAQTLWQRVVEQCPEDSEAREQLLQLQRIAQSAVQAPATSTASTTSTASSGSGSWLIPIEREANALREAIEANPTQASGYLALARLYRQTNRWEAAAQTLQSGLEATGGDFALQVEAADLAIEPFRRDLAIARAKRAEKEDALLQQREAELVHEINARELDLYRMQVDRQPQRDDLRYELGVRLLRCGQAEEALAMFHQLPDDWRAARGAGYCYRLWNNHARARDCFEQALMRLPDHEHNRREELLYELACCHAELGDYDRAVERGAELAESSPDYRDILALLPRWQARSGETRSWAAP
jgi:tetratricopeptide (TPR) repeat protein